MSGKWINHNGKRSPVKRGTLVDVRHRDGEEFERVRSGVSEDIYAKTWNWMHSGYHPGDIVAYRICEIPA